MKKIYLLTIISFVVSIHAAADQQIGFKSVQLSNGEIVQAQHQVQYAGGSDEWVMTIRYITDSIEDKEKLCQMAELLWPELKVLAEARGWHWASVKASKIVKKDHGAISENTSFIAYSIGLTQDRQTKEWFYANDYCGKYQPGS